MLDWETGAMADSVLVACPTYEGLSDLLDAYLDAYNNFKWPNRDLLLVDNTRDDGKYANSLRARGLNVLRVEPLKEFQKTFSLCWKVIAQYANDHLYRWILSLEQDVICPPLTIDTLLNVAGYIQAPFVTHLYPYHWGMNGLYQGLGCSLIRRHLLNTAMTMNEKENLVEGSIYAVAISQSHASLNGLLDIKHLDGKKRFWQYEDEKDPRVIYPPEYNQHGDPRK